MYLRVLDCFNVIQGVAWYSIDPIVPKVFSKLAEHEEHASAADTTGTFDVLRYCDGINEFSNPL
jgi:hypothetical protein